MAKTSSSYKGRYYNNRSRQPRKNRQIRVREVRLIGPEGKQVGVIPTDEALALAKRYGLDLVEISPKVRPPICKILDFGKYMYEEGKKQKKPSAAKLKEIKLRVRTEAHDYSTKLRRAEEFLSKGSKVKLTLMFRGRELSNKELGFEVINKMVVDLEHIGSKDSPPNMSGRNLNVLISPLPANKRVLKYTLKSEENEEIAEEDVQEQ